MINFIDKALFILLSFLVGRIYKFKSIEDLKAHHYTMVLLRDGWRFRVAYIFKRQDSFFPFWSVLLFMDNTPECIGTAQGDWRLIYFIKTW